jgi:hypothetical protein
MRRWTIRIIGGIVLILFLLSLAIQIVLWTDLPRQWAVRLIGEYSGLVVAVDSLSVSWWGHTTVRGISARLPLQEEEFFSVDSVELSHRSIPGLILRRSFGLESVRVVQPQLYVHKGADGRWDVQDALSDALLNVGGGRLSLAGTQVPQVHVEGLSFHMADANSAGGLIGPFSFEGSQQTPRSWGFALTSGPASTRSSQPAVEIRGTLIEDRDCTHTADFRVEPNDTWATAISGRDVGAIHAIGRWDGRRGKSGVSGAVHLSRLDIGPVTLTGAAQIDQRDGASRFTPDGLAVETPAFEGRQIRLNGGSIVLKNRGLDFQYVQTEIGPWGARLTGRWDLDSQSGQLSASWAADMPGEGQYNGVCVATVQSPDVGRKEAHLSTTLAGQSVLGSWRVVAQTQGSGAAWNQTRWRTTVQECTWQLKSERMSLDGVSADVAMDWPVVRLMDLTVPEASHLQASAEYDVSNRQWFARFEGQGIRLFRDANEGLDVRLETDGNDERIAVSGLRVSRGPAHVTAKGEWMLSSRELHNGRVEARWPQPSVELYNGQRSSGSGQWSCDANVTGTTSPLKLQVRAKIAGDDVVVGRRPAPRVEIPLRGDLDAEQVTVTTEPFGLFDGVWQARGQHQMSRPLTHLDATVEKLPVQAAAEMAGLSIPCEGLARARIELAVPNLDMKQSKAKGTWDVNQLKLSPLVAQEAQGRLQIGGGLVQFDDIELTQESGKARGNLHFAIDQPQRIFISFATSKWPVQLEEVRADGGNAPVHPLTVRLDSKADIQVNTVSKSSDGDGWFSGQLLCGDQLLGRAGASVSLGHGIMDVNDLAGELLGGTLEGSARIPLTEWTASSGRLAWKDVQLNHLGVRWPEVGRVEGAFSGTLVAVEATGRARPLEPIRLDLQTSFADGHIGLGQLGSGQAVAFLGPRRLLIDKIDWDMMGGHLSAWGQLSPHTGVLSLSMGMDFHDIDLGQVLHVTNSEPPTVAGKLAGQGTLITSTDFRQLNGEARIHLTQSDLGDNPVIHRLYDALSLNLGPAKPEGTGDLNVRFSGSRIVFPSLAYFNRGVEVRGAGQIDDFKQGKASTIQGYAVGSTRILKDVRLPGISELDRLMATLQSSAATVIVRGTVEKPEARIVPLPEVRDAFRYLLWQQLREKK